MLDKISAVPKPVLIGVAALLGLVALAATIGGQRKQQATPEAAQVAPAAPAAAPAQEAKPPVAAAPAQAAPAAAPVAVGLPPAVALDAPQQPVPGAVEAVEHITKAGEVTELARRHIDTQALALVDMPASKAAIGGSGWTLADNATMRVTRVGLVRVAQGGRVAMALSRLSDGWSESCAVAIGDPGNVVAGGDAREQVAGVELLPGWHRVFLSATKASMGQASRCRLAIKPAGADLANVAELFELPSAAAPAQAGEGSP